MEENQPDTISEPKNYPKHMDESFGFELELDLEDPPDEKVPVYHNDSCKGGECDGDCQDTTSDATSDRDIISSNFSADDLNALSISPQTPPSFSILGKWSSPNDAVINMYNIIELFYKEKILIPIGYCEPICVNLDIYESIYPLLARIKSIKKFKAGVRCKSDVSRSLANIDICKTKRKLSKEKHNPFILFGDGDCPGCTKSIVSSVIKDGKRLKGCKIPLDTIGKKIDTKRVKFTEGNYTQFSSLKNYILYCDFTNLGKLAYFNEEGVDKIFDKDKFIFWASSISENNIIFINQNQGKSWYQPYWVGPKSKIYIC